MVGKLHINLTKLFVPLENIKEIVDLGNWVPVIDYDFI
jgi:hypothetical protein